MRMRSLAALLLLGGCSESVPVAPPVIHYGEDLCAQCGMIISDDRFAAALVLEGPAGAPDRREALAFDDVGCLLLAETRHANRAVAGRWVRDFRSDRWLVAGDAVFVQSTGLHSPMAFGLAACADRASAQRLAGEFPGEILDLDAARAHLAADTLILKEEPPSGAPQATPGRDQP